MPNLDTVLTNRFAQDETVIMSTVEVQRRYEALLAASLDAPARPRRRPRRRRIYLQKGDRALYLPMWPDLSYAIPVVVESVDHNASRRRSRARMITARLVKAWTVPWSNRFRPAGYLVTGNGMGIVPRSRRIYSRRLGRWLVKDFIAVADTERQRPRPRPGGQRAQ